MEKNVVYGFLGGMWAGRFTGWISNLIITGITLYFYEPELYTQDNLLLMKDMLLKKLS